MTYDRMIDPPEGYFAQNDKNPKTMTTPQTMMLGVLQKQHQEAVDKGVHPRGIEKIKKQVDELLNRFQNRG